MPDKFNPPLYHPEAHEAEASSKCELRSKPSISEVLAKLKRIDITTTPLPTTTAELDTFESRHNEIANAVRKTSTTSTTAATDVENVEVTTTTHALALDINDTTTPPSALNVTRHWFDWSTRIVSPVPLRDETALETNVRALKAKPQAPASQLTLEYVMKASSPVQLN